MKTRVDQIIWWKRMGSRAAARVIGSGLVLGTLAIASGMATQSDDESPWVLACCSAYRECSDTFRSCGLVAEEAEALTHLVFYGEFPSDEKIGCSYYVVTFFTAGTGSGTTVRWK